MVMTVEKEKKKKKFLEKTHKLSKTTKFRKKSTNNPLMKTPVALIKMKTLKK